MPDSIDDTTREARLADLHTLVVRGAELTVSAGPDAGRTILAEGSSVLVGTGVACDLRLSDKLVSRTHLEVSCERDGVRIVDRGSRNGTFFQGARVRDVLLTGDAELVLGTHTRITVNASQEPVRLPFTMGTSFGGAVAHSEAMRHVFRLLEMVAAKDVTVLLEGDSGTGKEVLANALHAESSRRNGPFVVVDCGSIPEHLVESELFGHEKGSFTGATGTHVGRFERAHGGTIFLDEIGELPLEAQPKLLRALESRTVRRVGGRDPIAFDVRVVAATNRRLKEAVRLKEFREDLFYRLAVVHVVVPRLADRRDDIPLLAERFLRQITADPAATLAPDLARLLSAYAWPGNVRELRNVIERFATFQQADPVMLFGDAASEHVASGAAVDLGALAHLSYADAKRTLMDAYHRAVLPGVIEQAGGVPRAAERLGMSRTNLYRVLQELGGIGAAGEDG